MGGYVFKPARNIEVIEGYPGEQLQEEGAKDVRAAVVPLAKDAPPVSHGKLCPLAPQPLLEPGAVHQRPEALEIKYPSLGAIQHRLNTETLGAQYANNPLVIWLSSEFYLGASR